jgi:hypothetical protein
MTVQVYTSEIYHNYTNVFFKELTHHFFVYNNPSIVTKYDKKINIYF